MYQAEPFRIGLVVCLYFFLGNERVQALVDVQLLVAVFQQGAAVFFQLGAHIFVGLGELLFGHVQHQQVLGPGVDSLPGQTGAVFGADTGGNITLQLTAVELMVTHPGHHFSAEELGGGILKLAGHFAGDGQQDKQKGI